MAGITPIPTTRVGNYFIRQRLVNQVQTDQLDLFRLQTQVSTGKRIFRPSDDAPAALRAISLQRTLQRKEQAGRNLAGSRSVLEVADTALSSVSGILNDVRASALEVTSNLTSDESRQAAISQIDAAISSLVNSGNSNYNGRYLFGGSRTNVSPFQMVDGYVSYSGNEKVLQNYVDLEQLFTTNLPGTEVFGGISGEVRGSVDVNPQLTEDTLLTAINGGNGITANSAITVNVTNGPTTTSSIVDLSGTVTVGDVIQRIEANAPSGGAVRVDIVNNGLRITALNGGTTVRVSEVGTGRAARELGLYSTTSAPAYAGSDLDPVLQKTTALSDLLGIKSSGRLVATNANNDIAIRAAANGTAFDLANVVYTTGAVAGSEVATYNSGTNTLTVQIEDGESTANDVIAAINAEGTFTAQLDGRDTTSANLAGTGRVNIQSFGPPATTGGSGQPLDTASGLVLTNGGESITLDISGAETVEDLFNLISGSGLGLVAEVNEDGNGINVRSELSGADFTIGENGGTTATQLGIRTYNASTALADLNRGLGVPTSDDFPILDPSQLDSLSIVARDGTTLSVNLTGANSLTDVVNLINTAAGNWVGTTQVTASLDPSGEAIQLTDSSTATVGPLIVQNPTGTTAAEYLGFVPALQPQSASSTPSSGDYVLSGRTVVDNDLAITTRSGDKFWVDLTGTSTAQDVIDRIDAAAVEAGVALTARVALVGNGIELVDATVGGGTLTVDGVAGSEAANYLGFLPNGEVTTDGSGNQVLTSQDRNTIEVDSVFNSMIRLRTAIQDADAVAIGAAVERLDVDLDRVTFARGEIGTRLQTLDSVQTRLEDENVQLQSALSNEVDVDLVEAISNLTARQYALQASLQTAGSILNLSILDYI
ncbi:MAG: flagellar hook-associated protein FlgL [Pirellulales bacterium]